MKSRTVVMSSLGEARRHFGVAIGTVACLVLAAGCGAAPESAGGDEGLHATIGAQGGELVGVKGSALEGVHLTIPQGALSSDTAISVRPVTNETPLPPTAVRIGPQFTLEPAGLALANAAKLSLPFDETRVTDQYRFDDEVKVWALKGDGNGWTQRKQVDSTSTTVSVELDTLTTVAAGVNPPPEQDIVRFAFQPNPKFLKCLAAYPDDPYRQPHVEALVVRGSLNDGLFLSGKYVKPGLKFDMFTVEHSQLLADGTVDPAFANFGLAWYQSDLEANDNGVMKASIRTILLDQIFGFDPAVNLTPTGTFHVGFWFNDPNDAAACGFDVTKPTPFNGEHQAGPLAMISVPEASGLGPLCTKPDTSVSPAKCDP
ncbi:MAG TPA: hypothetical protein VK550_08790 [Polyangiaceae bacterium]|nr:hypothetical protein [Polyangiaceae bacterium]